MTQSSFYGDTPNYATDYPTQNDSNTNPVDGNTQSPSSFYPDGDVYIAVTDAAATVAQANAALAAAQASAAGAASSASSAASSASAAANSATNAASAVQASAGTATPQIDGTATVGTSTKWAHEDHVHPTDTSRAPLASPTFTGAPLAPTAAPGTNTTQLATTAFTTAAVAAEATLRSNADALLAPLASPTFTGVPAAPTPTVGDSSTKLATTAFVATATRIILTAAFTLFVSATGSDSNNGLTSGTAFLTIQKAIDTLASKYDLGGQSVTISVGAGSFAGWTYKAQVGQASVTGITVNGAGSTTIITSNIGCYGPTTMGAFQNIQVATGASTVGVNVGSKSYLYLGVGVTLGSNVYHFAVTGNSVLQFSAGFTIAAGCTFAFYVSTNSAVLCESIGTITLSGTPAWAGAFAYAENGSNIRINGNTFSGASTGIRYQLANNAVCFVNGAGASYLPGNAAGTTSNGALYV